MGFPNIPDNQVEVIQNHVTEILIITDMCGLQHLQMRVIFAGAIPFNNFMPDGINKGVEILDLHGGNPVHINLNVRKKLDKVLMGGKFAEQTVVNPTAFQKCHHLIVQMQLRQWRVDLLPVLCPAQQIIDGNPIEVCQRDKVAMIDNPLSLKADFILSLCELVVGGKEGLLPVEKTVIDRCVHLIYRKYFADPCPENMPILEDLYNALLQQDEKEAHHVATALEIYVKGSLNLFNHRTNVNVNNRIVCYDIKELGKQMKKLGMLIVQDQVWGRVTANRSSGKSTRYYMDEMHLLLKEEQTAAYSVEIWKRFRKWGGIPTGLTQNVKDLLSSREVENIFENSDMIIMLNQAAGDRQILAKQLNISPHQLSYVTHSGEGEGLLFFGNVILPFVDRFPTDLELYRIMTTKLGEVSEGAQK